MPGFQDYLLGVTVKKLRKGQDGDLVAIPSAEGL